MRKLISLQVAIGFLIAACSLVIAGSSFAESYVVIVNSGNSVESMSRKQVSKMLLGKTAAWTDGVEVTALDLPEDSAVRSAFSDAVLKKSTDRVKSYWLKVVFSGRGTPPDELADSATVVSAVAKNRGAIGYIASGTALTGVKTISVTE